MFSVYFSAAVLVALLLCQFLPWVSGRRISSVSKNAFWGAFVVLVFYYFYLVYGQYLAWRDGGEILKHLVPPYRSIAYVFGYHFTRFALYYLISFAAALVFLWVARYFNAKFGGRFFEDEEPYLGALAIMLLGDPLWRYAWIYYLLLILAAAVAGSLFTSRLLKKNERFSLRYLWLPAAISVIIVLIILY
ncbi:MAG TPA: hypothetical protein VNK70_01805 [Candidatus Paceibacterota bacterium]|nr:hypothetical protein [Candidatus Paceibacterota bacterium]